MNVAHEQGHEQVVMQKLGPARVLRVGLLRIRLLRVGSLQFAGLLCSMLACKTEADKVCLSQFASAQSVVLKVEAEDLASVNGSVAALDTAVATCTAAGRSGEVAELQKAHAQLSGHRDRLLRREEMVRQRTELSPSELTELIKSGDPKCPRGQGYVQGKSGQRIRCVGPQPIDMNAAQAEEYFKGRGYKVTAGSTSLERRFEYGAELLVFSYTEPAQGPPDCVTLYPPPEMSWQEATARVTGVAPGRLKADRPIMRGGGPLSLAIEESAAKVVARIGNCKG